MKYTNITKDIMDERDEICQPTDRILIKKAHVDLTYFAYHLLGITPYCQQHMLFKTFKKGCKRISLCSTRQATGKSVAIAVIALHSAFYNTMPSGIHKNTKIGIISKSDDQSKKLMGEIKKLVNFGDLEFRKRTAHLQQHPSPRFRNIFKLNYFSEKIDKNAANNMTQMSFKGGHFIKCFPPTEACRGESFDIVIIDEAAFVDENIYKDAIYPTITQTRGTIILSSTPRGQKGFFFKIFDPFDVQEGHEFTRYWFNWRQCENPDIKEDIAKKRKQAQVDGDIKSFEQEYEAKFTIDCESFFDSAKVDAGVGEFEFEFETSRPVCVGVDYGMTICNTVVSIVTKDEDGGLRLINQIKYPLGTEDDVVFKDLKEIYKRYPNIVKFCVDDCPQGFSTNSRLESEGFPVLKYNFRSAQADRNRGYYLVRTAINKGLLKYPHINELIIEMKALVEESLSINTRIGKPKGGSDDRCDSLLMACYPFLNIEERPMQSFVVGDMAVQHRTDPNTGADLTWKDLQEDFEKKGGETSLKKVNNPLKRYM